MDKSLSKKNVLWNMIGTTFNAFNSLFFMIIVSRINGLQDAGVFTLAFSLACLFCLIGGYEGRVYQVTDINGEYSDSLYIVHRIVTCILMMVLVVIYCLFMGYNTYKLEITILLSLMKCFEVFSDVFYGILQKNDKLYIVGKSLFFKSLLSVFAFILIDLISHSLLISCIVIDLIWFIMFMIYDLPKSKKVLKKGKVSFSLILSLFKNGLFSFLILFLSVYLVNAQKYALDGLVKENLQAIFGMILMPATVISLAGQYLLQPILNTLAKYYASGMKKEFNILIVKAILLIFAFGLLCFIAAYLVGIPVLNMLYGVHIYDYKQDLLIIICGAILYSMSTLLSAALTTIRYTFVQFIVFCISSLFSLLLSRFMISQFSIDGASLAYFLTMLLQFSLYIICYIIVLKKVEFKEYINEID